MAGENRLSLLIIGPRALGGAEGGVEKFAEEFVARACGHYKISVLCLDLPSADSSAKFPDVEFIRVPRFSLMKSDKALYVPLALWTFATQRFDRVFILGMNFGFLVPLFKLMFWRRASLIMRTGSVDYTIPKWGKVMRAIMHVSEWGMRFANRIVSVAPSLQRHVRSKGMQDTMIRNGLERMAAPSTPVVRQPRSVVAVGRVTVQKNYEVLIDAARRLGSGCPDVTIIGGGDLSNEAARLKEKLASGPELPVRFTGVLPRSRVMDSLASSSLYVNCSMHEGMSNAVLEAVQQGIPLILSRIEANLDLELPEHFYFDPADAGSLAMKIEEALGEPDRFVVDPAQFEDWTEVTRRYIALIDDVRVAAMAPIQNHAH